MKKYAAEEIIEAWGIFMGLCEEFPELYDQYVDKIEKESGADGTRMEITEEEKKMAMDKIWKRIKNKDQK